MVYFIMFNYLNTLWTVHQLLYIGGMIGVEAVGYCLALNVSINVRSLYEYKHKNRPCVYDSLPPGH